MSEGLTRDQQALVRLIGSGFASPRHMSRDEMERHGLLADFKTALRAGLIQDAGYECSPAGDDFLNSPAGRLALANSKDKEG